MASNKQWVIGPFNSPQYLLTAFICTICLLIASFTNAQTYRFQDAGLNDKLPNNQITKILQDQFGYMWFGTRNGLVKYDGINAEVFQLPVLDSTRQDKNRPVVVTALSESAKGDIWVGTANGEIARFDRVNNRLVPFAIGPTNKDLYKPFPIVERIHEKELEENVFNQQTTDSIFSQGIIIEIFEDSKGILWSSNHNQSGFFKIIPDTSTFHDQRAKVKSVTWYSDTNRSIEIRSRAKHILEDTSGTLWMSGDRGIIELHPEPFSYTLHALEPDKNHNWLNKFEEHIYLDSIIVVSSVSSGINVLRLNDKTVTNYLEAAQDSINLANIDISDPHFSSPMNYPGGNIQVSPARCLFLHQNSKKIWVRLWLFNSNKHIYMTFNPNNKQFETLDILLEDGQNIEKNPYFESMYQDRSGTIWASNDNGIFKITPQSVSFEWFKNELDDPNSLLGEKVDGIYRAKENKFWIATDNGLSFWNKENERFINYPFDKKQYFINGNKWYESTKTIYDLLPESDKALWLATNFSFQKLDLQTGKYLIDQIDLQNFGVPLDCFAIVKDSKENLWLGHQGRLIYFNTKTKENIDYTFPGFHFLNFISTTISSLLLDQNDNLWIGTQDKGMFCLDTKQIPTDSEVIPMEAFESFEFEGAQPKIIDSQGNLWATSPASGVIKINIATREVTQYTKENGLAHDNTFSIIEDNQHNIWIGTFHGLSSFHPTTNKFQNYYQSDGLPTDVINGSKASKTDKGHLLFPSNKGIISFDPKNIYNDPIAPPLAFTDFKIDNKSLAINENSPLKSHISLTKKIVLQYFQNDITIDYAALHYNSPEKNKYAVFMENEDLDWRQVGNDHTITYTNLPPGDYRFHVKAANSDDVWAEKSITLGITILSPWWATWWAYLFYAISFILVAFSIYRFQLNRKIQKAETHRLLELDEFKSRFYTNITHEFRTPLTIILGMGDQLMQIQDMHVKQIAHLLQRNANALLNLINQLLDLSKIRSNTLSLDVSQGDIIKFIEITLEPFFHEAQSKGLKLNLEKGDAQILMDFDREKFRQIIFNLISNAIKFTEQGEINIQVAITAVDKKAYFLLKVADTGIGIPKENQEKIFDNFFQSDNSSTRKYEGNGIGLALTKELIKLMQGNIGVASTLNKGSIFTVSLPITNNAELVEVRPDLVDLPNNPQTDIQDYNLHSNGTSSKTQYTALIIEDNQDLRSYLALALGNEYKISMAKDGEKGIQKAIKSLPDVIICDVMMPAKDGFEVCQTLKKDERTSHIPIIFLTAKTNLLNRIKGLHLGADAYLTKPFNKEELSVTIDKCIALRQVLRERYSKLGPYTLSKDIATQVNDNFLIKLNKVIKKHLLKTDLTVAFIANEMAMSRSQLHRKVQNITGKNMTHYIRFLRFQLAKQLLENTDKSIAEISYETGFNDPNYFSRKFNEEFGIRPSLVRNMD